MDKQFKKNIIDSYSEIEDGFIVHTAEHLRKIYAEYNIDPKSTDRRIFDLESLAHFFQKGLIDLFKRIDITKDDFVLSVGEGNGSPSRLLAKLIGCRIIGVDINPNQINKARECAVLHGVQDKVKYYIQSAEELNLNEKNFSKAFFNETTCHWPDKPEAFNRINRHLIKGARIGINEWISGDRGTLNDAYASVTGFNELYRKDIWFQKNIDEYRCLLEKAGFKIICGEDSTDRVDLRVRAKLKSIQKERQIKENSYDKIMGERAREIGENYYKIMIETHYGYLRYAVIVAEKIKNV